MRALFALTPGEFPSTPTDPRHGTANGYDNLRCRCARCREAWRIYVKERNHRLGRCIPIEAYRADRVADSLAQPCGTESKYTSVGCRCDACTEAASKARQTRRERNPPALHGRASSYTNGCRCNLCREAYREYRRERKRRS